MPSEQLPGWWWWSPLATPLSRSPAAKLSSCTPGPASPPSTYYIFIDYIWPPASTELQSNNSSNKHEPLMTNFSTAAQVIVVLPCPHLVSRYKSIHITTGSLSVLSVYLYLFVSVYLSVYKPLYMSVYLSVYPSIYLSVYLSIYLSVLLSVYISICLSV